MWKERWPLRKAIALITIWTMLVSGTATIYWLYWLRLQGQKKHDDKYNILAIVQTGAAKETLKTTYLAELLDLSVDRPSNLFQFDVKGGERKLLAFPLIAEAHIKKIKPSTLYIDYSVRQPIAFLADLDNAAIDAKGTIFPFYPYFTPKVLPAFYLGVFAENSDEPQTLKWGTTLQGRQVKLAFDIFNSISTLCAEDTISHLRKIDVSKAFADSYGQRQVVVIMDDVFEKKYNGVTVLCIQPRLLRLSTEGYDCELKKYIALRQYVLKQELQQAVDSTQPVIKAMPMLIDMRIPNLAFFKETH